MGLPVVLHYNRVDTAKLWMAVMAVMQAATSMKNAAHLATNRQKKSIRHAADAVTCATLSWQHLPCNCIRCQRVPRDGRFWIGICINLFDLRMHVAWLLAQLSPKVCP